MGLGQNKRWHKDEDTDMVEDKGQDENEVDEDKVDKDEEEMVDEVDEDEEVVDEVDEDEEVVDEVDEDEVVDEDKDKDKEVDEVVEDEVVVDKVDRDEDEEMVMVIDEPLPVLAEWQWLNMHQSTLLHSHLIRSIGHHSELQNGFERCVAFYLQHVFRTALELDKVFTFRSDFG
jgi:hypothetical protein